MKKRILMVAFHYPPIQGSSGVHRTLSFSTHLLQDGWNPTVLTVNRGALPDYRDENEKMIPAGVRVLRAPCLDTQRHLSLGGKYLRQLAIPDRWVSWVISATVYGLLEIAVHRPQVLYSTFPIASAHVIGCVLHRLSGVPWIADLRDPMAQEGYPSDPPIWRAFKRIEQSIMQHAACIMFSAPSALAYYAARYPQAIAFRGKVIENGYDEDLFADVERSYVPSARTAIRLVHAGVLYPEERDPRSFFRAVGELRDQGALAEGEVEIVLRGSGHDDLYQPMLESANLTGLIRLMPPVGYREALHEMLDADGLLLLQSAGCNFQIPAKVYEYFRARRPIIALTDPAGDTGSLLKEAKIEWIAPLDSTEEIKRVLLDFLRHIRAHRGQVWGVARHVQACSRSARAGEFVNVVNRVACGT